MGVEPRCALKGSYTIPGEDDGVVTGGDARTQKPARRRHTRLAPAMQYRPYRTCVVWNAARTRLASPLLCVCVDRLGLLTGQRGRKTFCQGATITDRQAGQAVLFEPSLALTGPERPSDQASANANANAGEAEASGSMVEQGVFQLPQLASSSFRRNGMPAASRGSERAICRLVERMVGRSMVPR